MRILCPLGAILFFVAIAFASCNDTPATLFTRLPSHKTGVTFNNLLKEDDENFSIVNYPYFYNGGGVAIGDLNNDSLPDIFFSGNMVANALFINKGNLQFDDITTKSGLGGNKGWCTGVTMVDINEDGWLDIYVCRSGSQTAAERSNLLYINNHNLTFTESSAAYGLADRGYSTQASFFDYDKDGDLDVFLINQSSPEFSRGFIDFVQTRTKKADTTLANKLYRNDRGHFTDVTSAAGITSTIFSFSLGLSTADINQDGWPDIFVGNDFEEADYLYINNHDGTFTDSLRQKIDHTSLFSMGVDIADYNNDQLPDIIILDMLPEDNYAQKMHMSGDNFNRYNYEFRNGMFYQYMKNSLQKNNGDGTFSEIGQLAGISNTDWSWSPLLADYDNDGFKDLFITNGYQRDNTDMQFMGYAMNQSLQIQKGEKAPAVQEYISHMPGINIPNYMFRNKGNGQFENKIKEWGFDHNTVSHGAAYADLDNDGDLDLITNNTGDQAGLYRNDAERLTKNAWIEFKLKGTKENNDGIGARIYAYAGTNTWYLEQNPVRGYQSSGDHRLHLGLGQTSVLDSVRIVWPDNTSQRLDQVKANKWITLSRDRAKPWRSSSTKKNALLEETQTIAFTHQENDENDFTNQFLLPHFFSHNGPCLVQGDVNGDGTLDIYASGGKDQAGELFLQMPDHTYKNAHSPALLADAAADDADAVFFDADNDHDLDLYVVSGGYEFPINSPLLQDRLYLNDGKGNFSKTTNRLLPNLTNKKCVRPVDFDGDGDLDLFIGGNVVQGRYPEAYPSRICFNDGHGNFTLTKPANAPLGIVNDAVWIDLNGDGKKDLIVVGEWSSLKAYQAEGALFKDVTATWFPEPSNGWWNTIAAHDFDHDGDMDLVVGNFGMNSQLKADAQQPMELHYGDVDGNSSLDFIITHYVGKESVPLPMRDDMIGQLPMLKKKFNAYPEYAKATLKEMLSAEQLSEMKVLQVNTLATLYLENTGKKFVKKDLPIEAQEAPVFAIGVCDLNHDGHDDILLAGNNRYNKIYISGLDANHGVALLGDGKGNFTYVPQATSGLHLRGDVRSLLIQQDKVIFGVNNKPVASYRIK